MQRKTASQLVIGLILLLFSAIILAACGGAQPAPTAGGDTTTPINEVAQVSEATQPAPAPTATDTALPSPTDTVVPEPADTQTPAPTDTAVVIAATDMPTPVDTVAPTDTPLPAPVSAFGLTADGLYYRGNPDPAAVTVIDYSDFL